MHRHTTHWSVAGMLHVGPVTDCADCRGEDLAEAVSRQAGGRCCDMEDLRGAGA